MISTPGTEQTTDTTYAARTTAFAALCKPGEHAWIVAEAYNPIDTTWRVDLLRFVVSTGTWMYQRYRYDDFSHVIYSIGQRLARDEALPALRRAGRQVA